MNHFKRTTGFTNGLAWALLPAILVLGIQAPRLNGQESTSRNDDAPATYEDLLKAMEEMRAEYERRIGDLETALDLLGPDGELGTGEETGATAPRNDAGLATPALPRAGGFGISTGALGQTDRFSNAFNPAVGIAIDTLAHYSTDSESRHGQDRFWLRAAELSLAAHIDPFGYAYAVIEATEGESASVIEAAGVLDRLPYNFSIKAGRLLADVTRFGQRHDHELPFVEKPGVLTDFIGGSLQGTGMEIHQWFGLTDEVPVRWSTGIYTELEGHSHAIGHEHEHAHDEEEHEGKRHLDNFHYTGRLTSYMDLDEENSLQAGGSVWWAPEMKSVHDTETFDTHRTVAGLDVTYQWQDPASRRAFTLGGEALLSNGTFLHEHGGDHEINDQDSIGGYLWCEYEFDPYWSVGALADAYATAHDDTIARRDYSGFVTWKLSHFNRLRFQYRYNDNERGDETIGRDYHEFLFQWSIVIGSHGHGLNW